MTVTANTDGENPDECASVFRVEHVHLVGRSYGGPMTAYFATQRPGLLLSLTLVNAAAASVLMRGESSTAALSRLVLSGLLRLHSLREGS